MFANLIHLRNNLLIFAAISLFLFLRPPSTKAQSTAYCNPEGGSICSTNSNPDGSYVCLPDESWSPLYTCQQACDDPDGDGDPNNDGECDSNTCLAIYEVECVPPTPTPDPNGTPTPTPDPAATPTPTPPMTPGCTSATWNCGLWNCGALGGYLCVNGTGQELGYCCADTTNCPTTPRPTPATTNTQLCNSDTECANDLSDNGIFDTVCACQLNAFGAAYCSTPTNDLSFLCNSPSGQNLGIKSAVGCLSYTGKDTINQLLVWSVGIGGGIGLLLLGYAGLMVTTAAGDPKRLQAGQELLLSIFAGLFLLATSAVLLNFIGVKILSLENLGFSNP